MKPVCLVYWKHRLSLYHDQAAQLLRALQTVWQSDYLSVWRTRTHLQPSQSPLGWTKSSKTAFSSIFAVILKVSPVDIIILINFILYMLLEWNFEIKPFGMTSALFRRNSIWFFFMQKNDCLNYNLSVISGLLRKITVFWE